MKLKIWEKYFLKETAKLFFLFIFSFYGLYVLIDYSSRMSSFHHQIHFRWYQIALYYLCEWVRRLDVLLPFALLLSTVRTLCSLNVHNELVALMAGGLNMRYLMRPFVFLALACVSLTFVNNQYLIPKALKQLRYYDDLRTQAANSKHHRAMVQSVQLDDESTIIFLDYDSTQKRFFDAYWIRSIDDIYRMKYLYPYPETPKGYYVDHLKRNDQGELVTNESFREHEFPEIHFNRRLLMESIVPPEEYSLSKLYKRYPTHSESLNDKEANLVTTLYHKLSSPWLCLFAVIAPAPFCIRFNRHQPLFFIYAFSIFGLVSLHLFFNAATVLGKRQVLPPFLAIGVPFCFFFGFFIWRFVKLR